jgi:hypothetical protein
LPLTSKFDHLIKEAVKLKCCKLCEFSYLRDDVEFGYCKKPENAFGIMPKIIHELDGCPHFKKKVKKTT